MDAIVGVSVTSISIQKQRGWFAVWRSPELLELISKKRNRNVWALFTLIAYRARYSESDSLDGLQPGQAMIGDIKACGLTPQEYRTAKEKLEKLKFAAFKTTSAGTIATLLNNPVYTCDMKTNNNHINNQITNEQQLTIKKEGNKNTHCSSDDELLEAEWLGDEIEAGWLAQGLNLDVVVSFRYDEPTSGPSIPKTSDFDIFWEAYPRKVGKRAAFLKWNQLHPPLDRCLAAIEIQRQSEQWRKDGGIFIPHPATWLQQGRWDDEVKTEVSPAPRRRSC